MKLRNLVLLLLGTAAALVATMFARGCSGKDQGLLPMLTDRQEAREKAFIRAHYFDSECFRKARLAAPEMKDRSTVMVSAYTVELGLTDATATPDGKLHTIDVAEDHRTAYFQETMDIGNSANNPMYGPVSLEACLKEVLTYNADNCRPEVAQCRKMQ
jgi:hypothetical protein